MTPDYLEKMANCVPFIEPGHGDKETADAIRAFAKLLRNLPKPDAWAHHAPPPYDDPDSATCPKGAWAAGWNACAEAITKEIEQ
jgi:hypothetical protein